MGLRGQLLFLFLCFHYSWSNDSVFEVRWDSSGTSEISNHFDVLINDVIRFNCTNELSNIIRTDSEQAYNQCVSTGAPIGQCQAGVPQLSAYIHFGVYQTGRRYYFYSTYGNDCADGVKLFINVLEARSTSSTVYPTIAASNTMNPTVTGSTIGSTGTTTGSTRTVTGSTGTVTGLTTSSTSVTSASSTVGSSYESGSSHLDKQYFLVIVAVLAPYCFAHVNNVL